MLILGFGAFFAFGCMLVVVGAYQPQLASDLDIGLRETGMLGAAIVSGIGLGVVAAGPLVDRHSGRPLFAAAAALTGLAFIGVDDSMSALRAGGHLFVAGLGAGFYETVLNATTVRRYGEDAVRRLAFIHSAATLGGMMAPLVIVAWIERGGGFVDGFRLLGVIHFALASWGLVSPSLAGPASPETSPDGEAPPHGNAPLHPTAAAAAPMREWITRPTILALLAVAFFYVGGETALTLFVVPYAHGVLGLDADRGRMAISAFWTGLLTMRIIVSLAPRPAGAPMVFWSALTGTGLLVLGLALRLPAIELLLGGVGLAMGALFPLFVALAGQAVPEARGAAVAVVVGLGAGGGFVLPWLLGLLGDARGPMGVMVGSTLACAAATLAGFALMRIMARERPADDPPHAT